MARLLACCAWEVMNVCIDEYVDVFVPVVLHAGLDVDNNGDCSDNGDTACDEGSANDGESALNVGLDNDDKGATMTRAHTVVMVSPAWNHKSQMADGIKEP